jgi:hypothetical protein
MPKVNGREFSYSKEGQEKAQRYAKKTGKKLKHGPARAAAAKRLAGKMRSY